MASAPQTVTDTLRERADEANEALRETAGRARHELEPIFRRGEVTRRWSRNRSRRCSGRWRRAT
jgi:hypothetical protein